MRSIDFIDIHSANMRLRLRHLHILFATFFFAHASIHASFCCALFFVERLQFESTGFQFERSWKSERKKQTSMHFLQTRLDDQRQHPCGNIWKLPNVNTSGIHIDLNDPYNIADISEKEQHRKRWFDCKWRSTNTTTTIANIRQMLCTAWQQPVKIGSTVARNKTMELSCHLIRKSHKCFEGINVSIRAAHTYTIFKPL